MSDDRMNASGQKSLPAIGFLTVTQDDEHGFFGGYLILNSMGRPLEFHCTAPVRPNRAQEILYGPTLEPYLCGERIGQTLLGKSKVTPSLAITDLESVLAARPFVSVPLALVLGRQEDVDVAGPDAAEALRRVDAPADTLTRPRGGLQRMNVAGFTVGVSHDRPQDLECVAKQCPQFTEAIDLSEPFDRIREAIGEARK
jgi:hypothetical protein